VLNAFAMASGLLYILSFIFIGDIDSIFIISDSFNYVQSSFWLIIRFQEKFITIKFFGLQNDLSQSFL
jgi:hypothetical protein